MENLAWYHIAGILYLSLWVLKMYIVSGDFSHMARGRIGNGDLVVPDGWKNESYIRLAAFSYWVGAAVVLILLLIPTLFLEGVNFFKSYSKEDLEHFTNNHEWKK